MRRSWRPPLIRESSGVQRGGEPAEDAQGALDLLGPEGGAEPDAVPVSLVGGKERTRRERDSRLQRLVIQSQRIDRLRELDPEYVAPQGPGDARPLGKVAQHRLRHE